MANTINTNKSVPGRIAKVAATIFADDMQFVRTIVREDSIDFAPQAGGYKTGDTIFITKPARFTTGTNRDITSAIQDINEEKVAMVLNQSFTAAVALTSNEFATDMAFDSFAMRVLKPLVSQMAQRIESTFIQLACQSTANVIGTAGSTVFNTLTMMQAHQRMSELLATGSENEWIALLSPGAKTSAIEARKGLFQSSEEISKQYKRGVMGLADGFTYLSNNLMHTHTTGTGTQTDGSVTTTAALTNGATTIAVTGLSGSGTITAGTVFTVAGAFAVHPITKVTMPFLQPFVVTTTATASSGAATLSVSPTIYSSAGGGLQNVSALPGSGAAVVFLTGKTTAATPFQNSLTYCKEAFRFASVPLILPGGMDKAAQETVDGLTIRVLADHDIKTDQYILRIDFLGGFVSVRPEWAVRVTA
jgi:hypothetical protein